MSRTRDLPGRIQLLISDVDGTLVTNDKRLTPHLTLELPLDQAAKAMQLVQSGHHRGKIALIVQ